jgi:hypothetical protein
VVAVKIIVGAVVGLVAGYMAGAYLACDWLLKGSNLCGLFGVFITAPLGLAVGSLAAWWISHDRNDKHGQPADG